MLVPSIIIHERRGTWARQLRPRFRGSPIRWTETRTAGELGRAASRSTCPIFVVDLADQPAWGLEALDAGLAEAPSALSLVLDPLRVDGVSTAARDLGATLVLGGVVVPPEVVVLLHRWLAIARQRSEAEGWSASVEVESDPWGRPRPIAFVESPPL